MSKIHTGKAANGSSRIFGAAFDAGIIGACAAVTLSFAVWTLSKRETVSAVAHVLIERTDLPMAAELEALHSPTLAKAVIEDLQLGRDGAFLASEATGLSLLGAVKGLASRAGLIAQPIDGDQISPSAQERWAASVETGVEPHTHVLKIVVTLPNPQLAVSIANALAVRYVQSAPESRRASNLDVLRQSVDGLQRRLESARQAEQTSAPEFDKLQARLLAVSALIKQGLVFDAAEQLDSESLQLLAQERLKLKAQISIESKTLLDQHPKMIEMKDQLARLENDIRAAVQKAESALHKAAQMAHAAQSAPQSGPIDEPSSAIELQLSAAQQKLNAELVKIANGDGSSAPKQQDRIVVAAEMPKVSSIWDDIAKSAYSALYGAGLGLGLVLLRRAFSRRPERRRGEVQSKAPRPVSAIAESERNIREFVEFAATARDVYSAPLTARAMAKADVAAQLGAILFANPQAHVLLHLGTEPVCDMLLRAVPPQSGLSVCIVDLEHVHNVASPAGLSDVLAGNLALDDAIRQDRRSGFDYVASGCAHRGSFGLELVILTLQDCYDLVVIDGLDVLSSDFETLVPFVTLAVLSDAEELGEMNYVIEQALLAENCHHVMFEDAGDMRVSKAA